MVRTKPAKTPKINQRLTSFKHPVRNGFRQAERKFQQIERQLAQPDPILMHINRRFDNIDQQFRALREEMNEHFTALEDRLDRLEVRIADFLKRYLRSV